MRNRRHRTVCGAVAAALLVAGCGSSQPVVSAVTSEASAGSTSTGVLADARTLAVPRRAPPSIDGTIEPSEWEDAVVVMMDDGTELLWLHADGSLFLGVRHDTVAAVNLAVCDDNRVRVLHSSAALGSAGYIRQANGDWRLEHDFDWCCRSATDSQSRDLLLASEGWLASIGFAGRPGEVEYRLVLAEGELRVAVSLIESDGTAAFWPPDLPAAARESLHGAREDQEAFATEAWMRVTLVG